MSKIERTIDDQITDFNNSLFIGLNELAVEDNTFLDWESTFPGEKKYALPAYVIQRKTSASAEKILDFLKEFHSFLLEQKPKVKGQVQLVDFVNLAYAVYDALQESFPRSELKPQKTFADFGIEPHQSEANLGVQVIVGRQRHGFQTGLPSDDYKDMLKHNFAYTILKLAEFNHLI